MCEPIHAPCTHGRVIVCMQHLYTLRSKYVSRWLWWISSMAHWMRSSSISCSVCCATSSNRDSNAGSWSSVNGRASASAPPVSSIQIASISLLRPGQNRRYLLFTNASYDSSVEPSPFEAGDALTLKTANKRVKSFRA